MAYGGTIFSVFVHVELCWFINLIAPALKNSKDIFSIP